MTTSSIHIEKTYSFTCEFMEPLEIGLQALGEENPGFPGTIMVLSSHRNDPKLAEEPGLDQCFLGISHFKTLVYLDVSLSYCSQLHGLSSLGKAHSIVRSTARSKGYDIAIFRRRSITSHPDKLSLGTLLHGPPGIRTATPRIFEPAID